MTLSQRSWLVWFTLSVLLLCSSVAAAQTWTFTGSMSVERTGTGLRVTLLSNGQVLVTGGRNASGTYLASTERYSSAIETFTPTGDMKVARTGHTATLILNSHTPLDGQVLIVGGETADPGGALASAELYNPATGTFTFTGSMGTTRSQHTAVLLQNGKVLVLGGENTSHASLATAEVYDPATGFFTPTASIMITTRREFPGATLLNDGRVLVTGGECTIREPSPRIWTFYVVKRETSSCAVLQRLIRL